MYEYHGWANIRITPGEMEEEQEKKLWEIVSSFKEIIDNKDQYLSPCIPTIEDPL